MLKIAFGKDGITVEESKSKETAVNVMWIRIILSVRTGVLDRLLWRLILRRGGSRVVIR